MVHQGGEFGPILDILLQYVEQLHQLVWWDLQQKQLFRNTIRSSIKHPQRFNTSFYINKLQYPARDAHGLDLGGLAAELIQLVFTKQHFLRYLIIICCWEKTQHKNHNEIQRGSVQDFNVEVSALIFTHGSKIHILQILQYVVNACQEPLECGRVHQLLLGQLGFISFPFLLLFLHFHFSGNCVKTNFIVSLFLPFNLFTFLSSGKRHRSICCRTTGLKSNFRSFLRLRDSSTYQQHMIFRCSRTQNTLPDKHF